MAARALTFSVFWSVDNSRKPPFTVDGSTGVGLRLNLMMVSTLRLDDNGIRITRNLISRLAAGDGQ